MLPVKHLDELQLLCVKSDLDSTAVYTNDQSLLTVLCFSSWSVKAATHLDLYFYERATYCCSNPLRYDQRTDSSQHYVTDTEENPSRDNEEVSSYYLGTLESSKNSGLSSSSFELSQYINGAEHSDAAGECRWSFFLSSLSCYHTDTCFSSVRVWTCASDLSSSQVLNPSCDRQLWARRPADPGHSGPVHTGKRQPAGNPQSGGRLD